MLKKELIIREGMAVSILDFNPKEECK